MSKTVIKVEELSKAYQIGQIGTGTISRDIERWVRMNVLRQDDPFLKIGETNDRSKRGSSDIVWSLKDINFEIKEGDAVGIIGRNGAGKSTLLKLLSRVTAPTSGRIKIKGRVASLLEVGTGFHPELSGRENIYLNGAILGMRKKEIDRKLDEIIDFSGVERYIDTPVKRYSSGMYVRLAFAVAAHLESEILIVDEVLAVGDAEFQKKCLGKMGEVSKGEGRTVLFVSHNMAAIRTLCNNSILIENGLKIADGNTPKIIEKYSSSTINSIYNFDRIFNEYLNIQSVNLVNQYNEKTQKIQINQEFKIVLNINVKQVLSDLTGYIMIKNTSNDEIIIESDTIEFGENQLKDIQKGNNKFDLYIPSFILPIGEYIIYLNFTSKKSDEYNVYSPGYVMNFTVEDNITNRNINRKASTSFIIKWQKI